MAKVRNLIFSFYNIGMMPYLIEKFVCVSFCRLLHVAKSAKEREDILKAHSQIGKFRKLANGGLFICALFYFFLIIYLGYLLCHEILMNYPVTVILLP